MRHGEGPRSGARGLVPRHWGRQLRIGVGNLPTPMGGCLPQQGTGRARARQVAYPNGRSPAPIGQCMPLRHSTLTPSCCGVPNRAVTSAFRAGSAFGSVFSLTGPPQGAVVVQNASGFRCFRRTQHEGGPKCVSVRRFWPDSCDFGQTQTHFGPRTWKDPGSTRDSDAFRTTKQLNHRTTGAGLAPAVADPGSCPANPGPQGDQQQQRARRLRRSPALRPLLEHEKLSRCHRYPATGDDPVVSR